MHATTGLTPDRFAELYLKLAILPVKFRTWPPSLGLRDSLKATLIYLRRNRSQDDIAATLGVSQPTISRAIAALTPLIAEALADVTPTADDLSPTGTYIVDGTLLPCWSWAGQRTLWSGKHKTTGHTVQVVVDTTGRIEWISDPTPGHRHDVACLDASGVLDGMDHAQWMGDKGYIGTGINTPVRKPVFRDLTEEEKTFNTSINRIQYVVERAIANLKAWRIFHTDYRRPLKTVTETISAVIGLYFFTTAE